MTKLRAVIIARILLRILGAVYIIGAIVSFIYASVNNCSLNEFLILVLIQIIPPFLMFSVSEYLEYIRIYEETKVHSTGSTSWSREIKCG